MQKYTNILKNTIFCKKFLLTTDFHPERKRDYPFNPCYLWSKKLTTDISNLTDFHPERKRAYPFNPCNLWSKKLTTDISELTDANPG